MNKIMTAAMGACVALAAPTLTNAQEMSWQPEEPITVVVPWSAGGSTDSVTRVVAGELSEAIGQTFVVRNQPGASGAVGTRSAWEADHDGQTMAAGAVADLGAYPVLGTLDVPVEDWRLYLHVALPALISVNADSDIETFDQLLEELQNPDGEPLQISSAGNSSASAITMQAFENVADIEYQTITYEGGNPAVTSTVSGETEVTAQTAIEQVDMIRAERLRPLAVVADTALELEGFGTVEPITNWLPEIAIAPNYFGLFLPADAPAEVIETMDQVWEDVIKNSEELRTYAAQRAALFNPSYGEDAVEAAMPFLSINAWQQFESGTAPNDPSEYGIPKPE